MHDAILNQGCMWVLVVKHWYVWVDVHVCVTVKLFNCDELRILMHIKYPECDTL